jgi:hypothetical protein
MAHFAKLGLNNIVEQVIAVSNNIAVTEEDGVNFINNLFNTNNIWKQTSYNTRKGNYYNSNGTLGEQSKAFRKNFAGIGYYYDDILDAFIPPKTFNSWILNEDTCLWEAPIQKPQDNKKYTWNEEDLSWQEIVE